MQQITATMARDKMAALLNEMASGSEPVEITRHGGPVAVVVSAEQWRRIEAVRYRAKYRKAARRRLNLAKEMAAELAGDPTKT